MKMKMKNIALSLAVLLGCSTASAQLADWPVKDAQLNGYAGEIVMYLKGKANLDSKVAAIQTDVQTRNVTAANANERMLAIQMEHRRVAASAAPTLEKCIAVSQMMGIGRANSFAGQQEMTSRRQTARAIGNLDEKNLNNINTTKAQNGTCSETDAKLKVDGCTKVGEFGALAKSANLSRVSPTGSSTISEKQYQAAVQNIQNTSYGLAPSMIDLKNSDEARAKADMWYQRASIFADIKAYIAAEHVGIPVSQAPDSGIYAMWNNPQMVQTWQAVNGKVPRPEDPSLITIVETMVNKDMFVNYKVQSMTGDQLTRELIRQSAITNYLLMKNQVAQENIQLALAALGDQTMSPVSHQNRELAQTGR